MARRIMNLLVVCLITASLCMLCVESAKSTHHAQAKHIKEAAHQASHQQASFEERVQTLRKMAAAAEKTTLNIIESLDDLDDLELTQLRIPKRALAQAVGVYGGHRRSLATYPSVDGARRTLMTYPPV